MKESYNKAPSFVQKFVDDTIKAEGGYVNDVSDSGGETNYGVTKASAEAHKESWSKYGWDGGMTHMPLSFAQDLYVYQYFISPRFDLIAEYSQLIAKELFDTGVNTGTKRPSKWLQELLNVFNNGGVTYNDIAVDGCIGQQTYTALESYLLKRGTAGEYVLYNALNILQGSFYINLATKREKDEKFIYGWLNNRTDFK